MKRTRTVTRKRAALAATLLLATSALLAQRTGGPPPVEFIKVPEAALISFQVRPSTEIEMLGTDRSPDANVNLRIRGRTSHFRVEIGRRDIRNLVPPWHHGADYATYVLWAVSPGGVATNLGEILYDEGRAQGLEVTTPKQAFWLMVTAEPDFAVAEPSPAVVLVSQSQSTLGTGNKGMEIVVGASYRTRYTGYSSQPGAPPDEETPAYLRQARKAMEVASSALDVQVKPSGAPGENQSQEAGLLERARRHLDHAEQLLVQGFGADDINLYARTSIHYAETARAVYHADLPARMLGRLRLQLEAAEAEAERLGDIAETTQGELTSARDAATQLEAALDLERRHTRDTEGQLLALREQLSLQDAQLEAAEEHGNNLHLYDEYFCSVMKSELAALGGLAESNGFYFLTLQADSLFEKGKFDLRASAHAPLARFAVLRALLFPGAAIRFEGHTDRQGSKRYNQWISEQRALAVYRFFLQDALSRTASAGQQEIDRTLRDVDTMLGMSYNAVRRQPRRREQWIASLNGVVIGKGPGEPVVDVPGANEQNRRVTLVLLKEQAGELASLCADLFAAPKVQP